MKFEVGKFYKTRDGRKAQIFMMDDNKGNMLGAVLLSDNSWCSYSWKPDGAYASDSRHLDLISEWREPIERKTTAYVKWTENPASGHENHLYRLGIMDLARCKDKRCQTKVEIIVREVPDEI